MKSFRNLVGTILKPEWKALKPNGLALLMIQASGMTREDFMADYSASKHESLHGAASVLGGEAAVIVRIARRAPPSGRRLLVKKPRRAEEI